MDEKLINKLSTLLMAAIAFIPFLMSFITNNSTQIEYLMGLFPEEYKSYALIAVGVVVLGAAVWDYTSSQAEAEKREAVAYQEGLNTPVPVTNDTSMPEAVKVEE